MRQRATAGTQQHWRVTAGDGRPRWFTAIEAAEGGDDRPRRFARIEAAEGGGGSSVDVLDVLIMCGNYFPLLPVQAYGRNSTKAEI